jgi:hypothetical protein
VDELSQPAGSGALPLRDILVVGLEQEVAALFATRQGQHSAAIRAELGLPPDPG